MESSFFLSNHASPCLPCLLEECELRPSHNRNPFHPLCPCRPPSTYSLCALLLHPQSGSRSCSKEEQKPRETAVCRRSTIPTVPLPSEATVFRRGRIAIWPQRDKDMESWMRRMLRPLPISRGTPIGHLDAAPRRADTHGARTIVDRDLVATMCTSSALIGRRHE